MIESVKQLKKAVDARLRRDEIERDGEGRAIVRMTVLNDEDFLSDFSAGETPSVSADVAEFLHERATAFLPQEPICLKIYSDCIDKDEQELYSAALREYYVRHYTANRRELKRNAVVSFIMAMIGLIALGVVLTFHIIESTLFLEALDIFAWVFIWEAVDLFFLERSCLRMERNRCLRFIDAKIEFLPRSRPQQ